MSKERKEEDQRAIESKNNDVIYFGRLITTLFADEPESQQVLPPADPNVSAGLIELANRCEASEKLESPLFAEIFATMKALHARALGHPYATCETVRFYLATLSTRGEINLLMTGPNMADTLQVKRSFSFGESQQAQYGEITSMGNIQLHTSEIPRAIDSIIGPSCKGLVYVTMSSAMDVSLGTVVERNCVAYGAVLALVRNQAGYNFTNVKSRIRTAIGNKRKLCIRTYDADNEDMGDAMIWILNQLTKQNN